MEVENEIVLDVMTEQFVWYSHVLKMAEDRLPMKMTRFGFLLEEVEGDDRPVRRWRQGVLNEMRECQLPEGLW